MNFVFTLSIHSSKPKGIKPSTFCFCHFSNLYMTIKYLCENYENKYTEMLLFYHNSGIEVTVNNE